MSPSRLLSPLEASRPLGPAQSRTGLRKQWGSPHPALTSQTPGMRGPQVGLSGDLGTLSCPASDPRPQNQPPPTELWGVSAPDPEQPEAEAVGHPHPGARAQEALAGCRPPAITGCMRSGTGSGVADVSRQTDPVASARQPGSQGAGRSFSSRGQAGVHRDSGAHLRLCRGPPWSLRMLHFKRDNGLYSSSRRGPCLNSRPPSCEHLLGARCCAECFLCNNPQPLRREHPSYR